MPETRGIPEDEPTRVERVESVARIVIAGSSNGAIRRILLNLIAITSVFISLGLGGGPIAFVFAVIAVTALLLLAMTDELL